MGIRSGIGRLVATTVFDMFSTEWEVKVFNDNVAALKFWENVLKEYTTDYTKVPVEENATLFTFQSQATS